MTEETIRRSDIPEWVWKRMEEMASAMPRPFYRAHDSTRTEYAFARYIMQHEEAPIDPLLIAAREIVASTQHNWPDSPWHVNQAEIIREGRCDNNLTVLAALEGLRRGIEMGRAGE